ncbi:MAG: hypothetical protein H3C68_01490 [Deltaproteobacteria bacterium]|nr:hypothetical protein [Deltaproteobacteria bacterium]MBZ0219072.1 glycoside hydrolase family 55 protein [Deltaproteobacteria bacterium]
MGITPSLKDIRANDIRTKAPWADVRSFGAKDDGSDDSAALQAAMNYIYSLGGGLVRLGRNHGVLSSVVTPVGVDVIGHGRGTVISILPGAVLTGGFVFLVNSEDAAGWVTAYPNVPCNRLGNFKIKNDNHATVTGRGIFLGASAEVFDFRTENLHQALKTTSNYLDLLTLRRIFCSYARGADYQIQISNLGDGLDVSQVITIDSTGSTPEAKGIYLTGCNGGQLRNIIGGYHKVQDSAGVVCSGWHGEAEAAEHLIIENSSVIIDGGYFWAGSVPRVKLLSTSDHQHTVSMRGVNFVVNHDDMPGAYDQYDLQTHPNYLVTVENCVKVATKKGQIALADVGGMLVKDSAGNALASWNSYSHLLSKRGVIGYRETPELDHALDCGSGAIFAIAGLATNATVTWGEATATYYYRLQLIYDPVRMVGMNDLGGESILELVNAGNGALMTVGFATRKRNAILRLYRGTATGSYDKYVDIPLIAIERLYDDGTYVNGYPWQARAAGAVDTLFVDPVSMKWAGAHLEMKGLAASPSAGTWKAADTIYSSTPAAGGKIGRVCTAAGAPGTWKTFGAIDA